MADAGWWVWMQNDLLAAETCSKTSETTKVITFADDWIMSCGEICDVIKSGCERLSVCGLVQGFCNRVHHWLCFHKLSQYFVWWNFSERSQCGHFKPAVIPHQNQKKKIMILHYFFQDDTYSVLYVSSWISFIPVRKSECVLLLTGQTAALLSVCLIRQRQQTSSSFLPHVSVSDAHTRTNRRQPLLRADTSHVRLGNNIGSQSTVLVELLELGPSWTKESNQTCSCFLPWFETIEPSKRGFGDRSKKSL